MHGLLRLRMLLARRPFIYWLFVAVLAFAIALPVASAVEDVQLERASWGEVATVYVATAPIEPGDLIEPSVTWADVPLAMVPGGAVSTLTATATATQRISDGEVIVDVDVGAVDGPLALLPAGWLAVMIAGPSEGFGNDTFVVGGRAVIFAAGRVAAPDAIIIRVLANALVVGIPAEFAAAVAEAASQLLAMVALSA